VPKTPYSRAKSRFDDDEPAFIKRDRNRPKLAAHDARDSVDGLPDGDRWSTWDQSTPSERGPAPHPPWLVTELGATDTELGILKTGKEADVHLIRRGVPGTDRSCLLAAKRYRDAGHRMFHRDNQYLEGRRVRDSRVNRAMENRTSAGREMISTQWANAEFASLCWLYQAGITVPYPVQKLGTEILLEFIGEPDGTAAPRLAEVRPQPDELVGLWHQLVESMLVLASHGLAHGDMSAYNLLLHRGRLVMIDVPQVVDVIANPRGVHFLDRDAANVAAWFTARGLTRQMIDARAPEDAGRTSHARPGRVLPAPEDLAAVLRNEARHHQ
jgi:RIO kinase 1